MIKYHYAGIDFSMSCPAITIGNTTKFDECISFFYHKSKSLNKQHGKNIFGIKHFPYETQEERFDNVSEWAMSILTRFGVKEVCIEDYAMNAKGRVFHIGENTGVLKHKMWKAGISIHVVSPTQAKKFFCGKGNAGKNDMHAAFTQKTGLDLSALLNQTTDKSPTSDVVDSFAMLEYGFVNHF